MHTHEPLNVAITEAARLLGVGRSTIYDLMNDGRLKSIRLGTRRLVTLASVRALVAELSGEEQ